jgi:predicted kinase
MLNQKNAMLIAATHTRSANLKAKLLDLADDYGYIARKAAAVVRQMAAGA